MEGGGVEGAWRMDEVLYKVERTRVDDDRVNSYILDCARHGLREINTVFDRSK